jgi:hypothetical protein
MKRDSFNPVHVTNWPEPQAEPPVLVDDGVKNISFERVFFTAIGFAAFFLSVGAVILSWAT